MHYPGLQEEGLQEEIRNQVWFKETRIAQARTRQTPRRDVANISHGCKHEAPRVREEGKNDQDVVEP